MIWKDGGMSDRNEGFSASPGAEWEIIAAWFEFIGKPWNAYRVLQARGRSEAEIDEHFEAFEEGIRDRMGDLRGERERA